MKILITGGAGFIGSHLVDAYLAEGHQVCIYDNFSTGSYDNLSANRLNQLRISEGDIRDSSHLDSVVKGFQPELISHHAAIADGEECERDPNAAYAVNVGGTKHVLEAARRGGVEKFIFASSVAVYGNCGTPALETRVKTPLNVYGVTKQAAEMVVCAEHIFRRIVLRYANVYGPRARGGVIVNFIRWANRGEPLIVHGDGSQIVDFIHVTDVARANLLATKKFGNFALEIFNIGSGEAVSVSELAGEVKCRHGIIYSSLRPNSITSSQIDVGHAETQLGFRIGITLQQGLGQLEKQIERMVEL